MRGIERYKEIFCCKQKFMNLIVGARVNWYEVQCFVMINLALNTHPRDVEES